VIGGYIGKAIGEPARQGVFAVLVSISIGVGAILDLRQIFGHITKRVNDLVGVGVLARVSGLVTSALATRVTPGAIDSGKGVTGRVGTTPSSSVETRVDPSLSMLLLDGEDSYLLLEGDAQSGTTDRLAIRFALDVVAQKRVSVE